MRITVDMRDGSKVIAEPSMLDLKQAGPEITNRLDGESDPFQQMLAAVELAHIALVNADEDVPKTLDKFLAKVSMDADALTFDGVGDEPDPTGSA